MKKVYGYWHNCGYYDGPYLISIHETEDGAIKAMKADEEHGTDWSAYDGLLFPDGFRDECNGKTVIEMIVKD